jgi:hypothetical protein
MLEICLREVEILDFREEDFAVVQRLHSLV